MGAGKRRALLMEGTHVQRKIRGEKGYGPFMVCFLVARDQARNRARSQLYDELWMPR